MCRVQWAQNSKTLQQKQRPSTEQESGLLSQDLDDGAYHEEDEQAECFSLRVQNIVALEWGTSHSLGLGSNDYTPALVMHVIKPTSGATCCLLQLGIFRQFTACSAFSDVPRNRQL